VIRSIQAHSSLRFILILGVGLFLASCESTTEPRLEGERISVLSLEDEISVDLELANMRVSLPRAYVNKNWAQSGGSRNNAMHHLAAPENLSQAWKVSIGYGDASYERLVSPPVVFDGIIYTIDIEALVRAFSTENGQLLWEVKLRGEELSMVAYGGGLAVMDGQVFVTTGYGFVAALDALTGVENWRQDLVTPLRSGASVSEGRVFITSYDNRLIALSAEDGSIIWDYVGIVENAAILGSSSPAIVGDTLVAAFSSGEVFAMRTQNGQISWQDALSRTGRLSAISSLNDIDGNPVIDRGRVYTLNHSGRMVSIDIRTGERVWESNVSGLYTPWVAGNFIFVLSADNELVALSLRDGRVRWVSKMQRFENRDKREGLIRWAGPVLVGDRLIVVSSHGYILSVSPYTGEILSGEELPSGSVLSPIVADKTVYILTTDGELIAYR
jgi:outer membrane protein assembly factor BamB